MAEPTTRVLLTLECDRLDADAMKAVARLAGDGELEMLGLFVEDEDLLRAARLPGLTEVSVNTGEVRSISAEQIREQVAGQARRAREEFEASARGLKIAELRPAHEDHRDRPTGPRRADRHRT